VNLDFAKDLQFADFRAENGKAVLLLNNPPLNILNRAMCLELTDFLTSFPIDNFDGLVIATEGDHFSAGADIDEHFPDLVWEMLPVFNRLCRTVAELPLPTVAVVSGRCLGGGAELARACRKVIALNPETLYFGVPEITLACFPPFGLAVFPRLSQNICATIHFLLTGQVLKGENPDELLLLHQMGLVDDSLTGPLEDMITRLDFRSVEELPDIPGLFSERLEIDASTVALALEGAASQIASLSPFVLAQATAVLLECARNTEGLRVSLEFAETVYLEEIAPDPDYLEGLTAYKEKRPPAFLGARMHAT